MNDIFPFFSIFVRYRDEGIDKIRAFLDVLEHQSYQNFEVILLDTPTDDVNACEELLLKKGFPCIIAAEHDVPSAQVLVLSRGDYFFIFSVGDWLRPNALEAIAWEIYLKTNNCLPDAVIFDYSERESQQQIFLPGWDPDLVQYYDYIRSAVCFSKSFVTRILDRIAALSPSEITKAIEGADGCVVHIAQTLLITDRKIGGTKEFQLDKYTTHSISVIIPNKDAIQLLSKSLQVFKKLDSAFEIIIVDNQSQDPTTWQMYRELRRQFDLKLLRFNRTFNYSAMINRAVDAAQYATILLLNNDVFISDPRAIATAVNYSNKSAVGIVGSVLRYADGRVQHAGMLLSRPTPSDYDTSHVLRFAKEDEGHHIGALAYPRNWLSVTGAFQVMRKAVFEEAGGYDEVNLPIEFNDVDFCLRVRGYGLRIVCLPLDEIIHDESQTRSKIEQSTAKALETEAYRLMIARWGGAYKDDPFYNKQLKEIELSRVITRASRKIIDRLQASLRDFGNRLNKLLPKFVESDYAARAGMPIRLNDGVCVVATFKATSVVRSAAIKLATLCRDEGLNVSFFDHSSRYVYRDLNGIAFPPFPDQSVTLYVGDESLLTIDKNSLGEGRVRILYLCKVSKRILCNLGEQLLLFDQIWVSNKLEADQLIDFTPKPIHVVPLGPVSIEVDSSGYTFSEMENLNKDSVAVGRLIRVAVSGGDAGE